jgi:RNA polymerase sigma factor (sigma-70 family)
LPATASGTLRPSLKHLSDLFGGGTALGLSDGELLRRYATSHDGPAFEVLVARHGPMVAATCRAILHDLHDEEDAFQATFLVLARRASAIRAGDALGGWLHRVAYRAAVQLNIEAKRRRRSEVEVMAMEIPDAGRPSLGFDARSILHEEIDRLPESQRLPVVLCDLEGLTYEQAAGRLNCTIPILYHRLAKGRKRLRDRLIRRSVTAAAVGPMEISRVSATAAVPTAWATAAMAAATGGPIPVAVAALTHSLIRSLLITRLKLMTAAVLALGTMISAGVVTLGAVRPDAPSPPPPAPAAASIPPPRADEPKPSARPNAQPGTLIVEARELSTDALMRDVRFEISSHDSSSAKTKTSASTDASGAARFSPPADVRYLYISASRPGFVSQVIRWDYNANSPSVPDHFLIQMERATTVSGRVLDQDQKPVAGATVVITVKKGYPKSRQWVDVNWEKTRTDADGRWSFSGVPEKPDSIELATYHYRYLSEHDCFYLEDFKPLSALRDGSATLRLRRGTPIEVTVRSPADQPVANAEVFYGEGRGYANALPPVKMDDQGKFTLGIKPGTVATLIARAPGFGPTLQRIKIGEEPSRVDLTLQPAHSLRGRVIDRQGKPIARAEVWVYWSGSERSSRSVFSSAIAHQLTTDAGGRFDWKEAPGTGAHVNISAAGFASKADEALASDVDHEIVLIRPTMVKATVIDRETGQPIPRFTLSHGAVWTPGSA